MFLPDNNKRKYIAVANNGFFSGIVILMSEAKKNLTHWDFSQLSLKRLPCGEPCFFALLRMT